MSGRVAKCWGVGRCAPTPPPKMDYGGHGVTNGGRGATALPSGMVGRAALCPPKMRHEIMKVLI